jgi:hypothetical protein
VPLHLLTLLVGAQIVAPDQVRLWRTDLGGRTIRVQRVGVTVVRSADAATISWPDGSSAQYHLSDEPTFYTPNEIA